MSAEYEERMSPCLGSARQELRKHKFADEQQIVERLLKNVPYDTSSAARIQDRATALVVAARNNSNKRSLLDTFLAEYGLSNSEGIALMCLAESLLRVPDQTTANELIADKVSVADWSTHVGEAESTLVNASTWALMLTGKMVMIDREFTTDPRRWLKQLTNRLSEPVVQSAMRSAMQILGREFVLGQTIDKALARAKDGLPYSFDMLGEAARTDTAAKRYLAAYSNAIRRIGESQISGSNSRSSISIKLSALHPRYEVAQRQRVLNELVPTVRGLCAVAKDHGIDLTIDAEESDRLDLSLDVFECLACDASLGSWDGLGIVVQAYGKRAESVLVWLKELSVAAGRRFPVRLVKGAYWDAEIKHAQVMGYPSFPVFTRKAFTDCSYLVCAKYLFDNNLQFRPQFATHNAQSVASIMEMAGENKDFEFQRLHGMGGALYDGAQSVFENLPPIRTYAPVGGYDDLLAYLVRRLLENGANSSFVNRFLDDTLPAEQIVKDPFREVRRTNSNPHSSVPPPSDIFGAARKNSQGLDLTNLDLAFEIEQDCSGANRAPLRAASLIFGKAGGGSGNKIVNPANTLDVVGSSVDTSELDVNRVFALATREQPAWNERGGVARAALLRRVANRLEEEKRVFVGLLCREAGKTIPDAIAEVREAVDFCRYYALQAQRLCADPEPLPGPTGELNELSMQGRGVFVCISPWNFPLAIFTGQVVAALAAGNTVIAKPAEETTIVAFEMVRLLHQIGIPANACQLITGDGSIGAALVKHSAVAGVAFTGSNETARSINLSLAQRPGAIVPLIAETGGQNAMIVDSTALLEQVVDDVIQSAFISAGQRCSALRVLFVQDDIADAAIEFIRGAMDELSIGDPSFLKTDIGPVISKQAVDVLESHIAKIANDAKSVYRTALGPETDKGHFVAPTMIEIERIDQLSGEVFGPVLHVIRFQNMKLPAVLESINNSGYGLTLGIHSRIESRTRRIAAKASVGNVYVNRNMTGAIVGSQPFGGQGLSGTGPKAGGPHYLQRFAVEKVVSINTVATGGNAELLLLEDSAA